MVDAVTGDPLPIKVLNNSSKEVREYLLQQPSFRILLATSKILADIGLKDIEAVFEGKDIFKFIGEHGEKVLKVLATVLDNSVVYSEDTFEFLRDNLTAFECYDLLSNVVLRIGAGDFQKSIIKLTPMSLLNQEKIIDLMEKSSTLSSS